MAPDSRIILTRHAQAEHNVTFDWSIRDAPLTPLGIKQAASLAPKVAHLQAEVDLLVTSPLTRTIQTTRRGWAPALQRLGLANVILFPQAQEVNDYPCDTGRPRAEIEGEAEFAGFDLAPLTDDWTSKRGFWADDDETVAERARWVRRWLRARPEKTIVLVAHGDILRRITAGPGGPSGYGWNNAEARIFRFDPESVDTKDCFLDEKGVVAASGGYDLTSTEADMMAADGEPNGKI
ncbi:hypothetical protein LTR53_002083 [Teratosphaeriaceae sp. CCFEE 6253]|nr:hypothetical protein LTR53_002083 [Teratosphaeriaceae sp. CCFEE 6253]